MASSAFDGTSNAMHDPGMDKIPTLSMCLTLINAKGYCLRATGEILVAVIAGRAIAGPRMPPVTVGTRYVIVQY